MIDLQEQINNKPINLDTNETINTFSDSNHFNNVTNNTLNQISDDVKSFNGKLNDVNNNFNINEQNNSGDLTNSDDSINSSDNKEVTNCLALTVKKDYHLSVAKNFVVRALKNTWRIAISIITLHFLEFFL